MNNFKAQIIISENNHALVKEVIEGSQEMRSLVDEGCTLNELMDGSMLDGSFQIESLKGLKEGVYEFECNENNGELINILNCEPIYTEARMLVSSRGHVIAINMDFEVKYEDMCDKLKKTKDGVYTMFEMDANEDDLFTADLCEVEL